MNEKTSFKDICIVFCGILKPEIDRLQAEKFCDAEKLFFTAPGLHEWHWELEKQLGDAVEKVTRS